MMAWSLLPLIAFAHRTETHGMDWGFAASVLLQLVYCMKFWL